MVAVDHHLRLDRGLDLDAVIDGVAQDSRYLDDQLTKIDRLANGALTADDAEDAARELGALAGRQPQVAETFPDSRIAELGRARQLLQESRACVQCCKNVVQVMRDTRSQTPDRLQ